MKSTATRLLFGCLLALFFGCAGDSSDQAGSLQDQSRANVDLKLILDDGSKWQVDDHTRASSKRMKTLVTQTPPIESVDDARALATALDAELGVLVRGCTMTGPAHDQLHVILAALFPRVESLKKTADTRELRKVQQEIASIFDGYDRHFE